MRAFVYGWHRGVVLAHVVGALPAGAWFAWQGHVWIACLLALAWVLSCFWWIEYGGGR